MAKKAKKDAKKVKLAKPAERIKDLESPKEDAVAVGGGKIALEYKPPQN